MAQPESCCRTRTVPEWCGYTAHLIAVDAFARMCPDRSAEVVDMGCGTGLVGVELARLGFATFAGVDIIADNYEQHIAKLVERDLWRVEEITSHNYMSALDRPGRLIVVRR